MNDLKLQQTNLLNTNLKKPQEKQTSNKALSAPKTQQDTFETSILPYEDCCTVFTPRHPRTKPILEKVIKAEQKLDREALMDRAIEGMTELLVER